MRIGVCLAFAFLVASESAYAHTFTPHLVGTWYKKIDHQDEYNMDAFFVSSLEGDELDPYEGVYPHRIRTHYVIAGGRCRWNYWPRYMDGPVLDPNLPLEEVRLPWFTIVAQGPKDPNTPDPLLSPLEDDDVLLSSVMHAASGLAIPLQLQVIDNLNDSFQLPRTFNVGQGTWHVEWGELEETFTTLEGRYYLIYSEVGVRLADFVPEPSTAVMALLGLAALRLRARR